MRNRRKKLMPLILAAAVGLSQFTVMGAETDRDNETVLTPEKKMYTDSADTSKSGTWGEGIGWNFDAGVLTISGSGNMNEGSHMSYPWLELEINKVIVSSGITSIPKEAFYASGVTEVQLPEGLLSIGDSAFMNCKQLSSINIPASVTNISSGAFRGCDSLRSITIPEGLTEISDNAFLGAGLTEVTIPESVLVIGINAFGSSQNLERVTMLGNNVTIKYNAFRDCPMLTSVRCKSVSNVEFNAFINCKALTSVEIPGVINIGNTAFQNDSSLTSVAIGDRLKVIEGNAFSGCTSLPEFIIPDTLEEIGYMAFYRCENLAEIGSLGKVTVINDYAFGECYKLKKAVIPEGVTIVGKCAFSSCYELEYTGIPGTVETICDFAFFKCNKFVNVEIPSSVKVIGKAAFDSCENLKKVYVPASVQEIDSSAFLNCKDLTMYGKTGSAAHEYANHVSAITFIDIDGMDLSECSITVSGVYYTYTGSAVRPEVTVKNGSRTLIKETDYTVAYKNNSSAGNASIVITGKGDYKGTITKTFTIQKKSIASGTKAVLPKTAYPYRGSAVKPSLKVTDKGRTLKSGRDYSVQYLGNKNVGRAIMYITGKGNYTGSIQKTFDIVPKSTSISKLSAGKKQFTVKWKTQTKQTTGYQIQYSTNKSFKNGNAAKLISNNKTSQKQITKLKTKKTYYVRIRTYKTVKINGKSVKLYSEWSKTRNVKTK